MNEMRPGVRQGIVLTALLVAVLGLQTPARAGMGVCFVNDDASGANTGADWANAYTNLQSALADTCTQIWVAAGIYKPHASDRTVSFNLENNTAIYGGFNGTETLLGQRDPVANITTLSGDLAGDDSGTNDGFNASFAENSYHVAWANGDPSPVTNASLDGFTITGGHANFNSGSYTYYDGGAGMLNYNSSTTLANLIFRNNYAQNVGGGLYIDYVNAPTLTNVTFSGNYSAGSGGGLYIATSSASLTNVSFSDNHALVNGGGLYTFWLDPELTNVTFSGNSAGANGGGLYNMSNNGNDPILTNVTFSGNTASSGGGLYSSDIFSGIAQLNNVIIANSTGGDCVLASGSLAGASSNNLIEDTGSNACGLTDGVNGNIVGADPHLGSLTGSPAFLPLQSGSPAIDAGTNTGCTATDQRGVSRPQGSACDIGAVEALVVSNTNDSGAGSLRQAIADAAGDVITFDASLSGQTITLTSDTLLILNHMTIDGSALASKVTINGNDNLRVFLVGGGVTATLNSLIVTQGRLNTDGGAGLANNGTLTIINSTFSAHTADNQFGGAIVNNSTGNLTVIGSTFDSNSAFSGGAIANYNQLAVENSTFTNNSTAATGAGGAIYTDGASGTLTQTIVNSTFSSNSANIGGAIWSSRTQTITNSTFSGNIANLSSNSGGAVWQDAELLNYANTIMANSTGGDCKSLSPIVTNINNLVEDGSCAASLSGDPNLDTLASNGGPNQTFALLPGSPAINAGDDTTCSAAPVNSLDQRGIARPNGDHCDLGAYEHEDTGAPSVTAFDASDATSLNVPITTFTASDDGVVIGYLITESAVTPTVGAPGWTASAPATFTVASTGSHTLYPWAKDDAGNVSAVYGSPETVNVCFPTITVTSTADSGAGTLRQAIADACQDTATIDFASGLSGATIHLSSTLTITNPAVISFKYLTIDGSSLASQITLSGDSDNNGTADVRLLDIENNALLNVTLDSLTFTEGQASGDGGGAIVNGAYLTISNSTFLNNSAIGYGGAIVNNRPLIVTNSTFSGNSSTGVGGGGGAIMNSSNLSISGSTFSGNTGEVSNSSGGAIFNTSSPTTINNSTFSGNSATAGGAILTTNDLTIINSTISGNAATYSNFVSGLDIQGGTTRLSNTIIANSLLGLDCLNNATITGTNNLIEDGSCSASLSGDPNLGALADNGGPTLTFALLPGSPAINAGADPTCAASPVSNLDQRGFARSANGPHCDIGAYEYQDAVTPTVTSFNVISPSASLTLTITAFTASDNLTVTGYLVTESAAPPAPAAASWSATAPINYTVGSDGVYTLYPWVKDGAGNVSAVFGSPASVNVDTTAPTAGSLVAPDISLSGGATYTFTLTFSDNMAINVASLDANDLRVTGPGGFDQLATFVSVSPAGNGTPRTATYQITPPGGAWDSMDNGTYTLAVVAGQVLDTTGNSVSATVAGNFQVSIHYTLYLPLTRR